MDNKYEIIGKFVGMILLMLWIIAVVFFWGYFIIFWYQHDNFTAMQVLKYSISNHPIVFCYILAINIIHLMSKRD